MPQTRANCPRCHQPLVVEVDQLFDQNTDPTAKQRLLSGNFNIIQCPNCGYQGALATPIIYHDPEKELLLTYFPPELGMPVNEQERLIGPLINQVVNRLPPEKRKGYLLRPQSMLTMQTLIERILEADGITREMIQAQQQRLNLLQRLLSAPKDSRPEIVKNEEALLDEAFFSLLSRLAETALLTGDQKSAQALGELQEQILPLTETGRRLQSQAREAEAAVHELEEAGKQGLTREKLLDLMIAAPTDARLSALVSLTRNGLDYTFFQILADRIDRAQGSEKQRLIDLREKLLQMTEAIDKQVKARMQEARKLLEAILSAPDVQEAARQNLGRVDELFITVIEEELKAARQKADLERSSKLQSIMDVIEKASAPPPEYELIQQLLDEPDDNARRKLLEQRKDMLTPEFLSLLTNLAAQMDGQDPELAKQLQAVNRLALRVSMEMNLNK
jgi:hypothetical protein